VTRRVKGVFASSSGNQSVRVQVASVFTEAAWSMMEASKEYDPTGYAKIKQRLVLTWEAFTDCIPPTPDSFSASAAERTGLTKAILVYRSASEWAHYKHVGKDPVLHIEVIAPHFGAAVAAHTATPPAFAVEEMGRLRAHRAAVCKHHG